MMFVSDLDHTLIYSKRDLNGEKAVPVEYIGENPITYMTPQALELYWSLRTNSNFMFTPCTLRDYDQTMRISIIHDFLPKFMICENGGRLYVNGKEDTDYRQYILNTFDLYLETARKMMEDAPCTIKDNQTFLTCVFKNSDEAAAWAIRKIPILSDFDFDLQHRKFYIIPKGLDKSVGLSYLIKNYGVKNLVTSGDGMVDRKFTKMGAHIFLPNHAVFSHSFAYVSKSEGVKAGEEILEQVVKLLERN